MDGIGVWLSAWCEPGGFVLSCLACGAASRDLIVRSVSRLPAGTAGLLETVVSTEDWSAADRARRWGELQASVRRAFGVRG